MKPKAVNIGAIRLDTPLILSPMAGVTNPPFRKLCREASMRGIPEGVTLKALSRGESEEVPASDIAHGSGVAPVGLYVVEMVTSRALVEGHASTHAILTPEPGETVRSVQLYGVDPGTVARAAEISIQRGYADHIDLNFGCPVPKVTKKGGGSALPWKLGHFAEIVGATVEVARRMSVDRDVPVPVSVKIRTGIDDEHTTYLDAGRLAQDAGVDAVTLHARTTDQFYSGEADWERIAALVEALDVPVFGNGDVFDGDSTRRMMEETGCAGVAIGRAAQGRPWVFEEITAALWGSPVMVAPRLEEICEVMRQHAAGLVEYFQDETAAMKEMRKHTGWYLRGFRIGGEAKRGLHQILTLDDLRKRLDALDQDQDYPDAARGIHGRTGQPRRPHLPHRWLETRTIDEDARAVLAGAELGY
ncbi:MAG: tRNA dihydrouridine synthase DusB [Actinomycetaceae bacterium]|nr:tRNA dihydrouridine synthase DusB [Actinomycetaceae bacterium]